MFKLFSGTSNISLVNKIAKLAKTPLSRAEIVRFDNSEVRVTIQEKVKNQTAVVIQSTANPTDTNLMELFFFCDALKRQEVNKIIGVIPYFGYARQNVQHRIGESVSANVIIRFLESIGFDKIYTFDLHNEATEGVFSIPFKNLSALFLLAEEVKTYLLQDNLSLDKIALVSPDQGGIERTAKFGSYFFGKRDFSLSVIEKKRNLNIIHQSEALDLYGNVENKVAILIDDIVTSGNTLVNAANFCLRRKAKKTLAVIIHHDFSKETPKKLQNSALEKFFTTDTISLKKEDKFDKLKEISIAPLIADELLKL